MKKEGKVALVIDISGSMGFIDFFALGKELYPTDQFKLDGQCRVELLEKLEEEYDTILFITDGVIEPSWSIILNANSSIRVIRVDPYGDHRVTVI